MKRVCLLLILFASFSGFAQRVDLDRYYFTASYRDLPRLPVDSSYRTFSVSANMSKGASFMLHDEQPDDRISIVGWQRVTRNGDLRVDLNMEDITIENSEVKEREQILTDKAGKEIGRRYFYHMQLTYTFAAAMQVHDRKGQTIMDQVLIDRRTPHVYNTKEFASSQEALNSFVSNVFAVTSAITSFEATQTMANVNAMLNSNLGFMQRTVSDYLWILDSKRHAEYQAHRQAWAAFKQAMFQMRADKPLNEVADMLKPVIAYFNAMKTRYNSNSKGDRKMRYASYYNLAKIYYYLDDPDASLYEAGQLMINDYDERDGRSLEAAATGLKRLFEINNIRSRHFPVVNDVVTLAGY